MTDIQWDNTRFQIINEYVERVVAWALIANLLKIEYETGAHVTSGMTGREFSPKFERQLGIRFLAIRINEFDAKPMRLSTLQWGDAQAHDQRQGPVHCWKLGYEQVLKVSAQYPQFPVWSRLSSVGKEGEGKAHFVLNHCCTNELRRPVTGTQS